MCETYSSWWLYQRWVNRVNIENNDNNSKNIIIVLIINTITAATTTAAVAAARAADLHSRQCARRRVQSATATECRYFCLRFIHSYYKRHSFSQRVPQQLLLLPSFLPPTLAVSFLSLVVVWLGIAPLAKPMVTFAVYLDWVLPSVWLSACYNILWLGVPSVCALINGVHTSAVWLLVRLQYAFGLLFCPCVCLFIDSVLWRYDR